MVAGCGGCADPGCGAPPRGPHRGRAGRRQTGGRAARDPRADRGRRRRPAPPVRPASGPRPRPGRRRGGVVAAAAAAARCRRVGRPRSDPGSRSGAAPSRRAACRSQAARAPGRPVPPAPDPPCRPAPTPAGRGERGMPVCGPQRAITAYRAQRSPPAPMARRAGSPSRIAGKGRERLVDPRGTMRDRPRNSGDRRQGERDRIATPMTSPRRPSGRCRAGRGRRGHQARRPAGRKGWRSPRRACPIRRAAPRPRDRPSGSAADPPGCISISSSAGYTGSAGAPAAAIASARSRCRIAPSPRRRPPGRRRPPRRRPTRPWAIRRRPCAAARAFPDPPPSWPPSARRACPRARPRRGAVRPAHRTDARRRRPPSGAARRRRRRPGAISAQDADSPISTPTARIDRQNGSPVSAIGPSVRARVSAASGACRRRPGDRRSPASPGCGTAPAGTATGSSPARRRGDR